MRNDIIDTIRLDITKSSTNVCVYVRTGDTRTLEIVLTNNGNVVNLNKAIFAAIYIEKESSTLYQTVTRTGNKLRYTLHTADVATAGENKCRIVISFEDGTQIASPEFAMIVESLPDLPGDLGTEEGTSAYTALTDALASIDSKTQSAEASANKAEASALRAEAVETDLNTYVTQAAASATAASGSATAAASSATSAESYKTAAANSATASSTSATASATSATASANSATSASGYATAAASSAEDAEGYATSASASAATAAEYEQYAGEYMNSTWSYKQSAESAADTAWEYKESALSFSNAACEYKDAAQTAAQNAEGAASSAAVASTNATNKANAAASSVLVANAAASRAEATAATIDAKTTTSITNISATATTCINNIETKGAETLASIPEDYTALSNNVTALNTTIQTKADKSSLAKTDASLDALWKLNKGQTYDFYTSTQTSHADDVVSGGRYADIEMLGGMSRKWNQLNKRMSCNVTNYGLTVNRTTSRDSINVTGTSTYETGDTNIYSAFTMFDCVVGHKYCVMSTNLNWCVYTYNGMVCTTPSRIYIATCNSTNIGITLLPISKQYIAKGNVINDEFYCGIFDLTAMFGSGNEPTSISDEKIKWIESYALAHPSYDSGSIVTTPIAEVESVSSESAELGKYTIPTASLTSLIDKGYGMGISDSCYNSIEYGKTYKNMKSVDLGSLDWGYSSTDGQYCFSSLPINDAIGSSDWGNSVANGLCSIYSLASWNNNRSVSNYDMTIAISPSKTLSIRNSTYNNVNDFKTAMSGVILHYESTSGGSDYVANVLHKKVAECDLGALSYSYDSSSQCLVSSISNIKNLTSNSQVPNIMSSKFKAISWNGTWVKDECMGMFYQVPNTVYFYSSTTDASAFKTAMNGQKLQYELSTEQIYDVTDLLTEDTTLECESGGTITFVGNDASNTTPIPHTLTYIRKLDEVE